MGDRIKSILDLFIREDSKHVIDTKRIKTRRITRGNMEDIARATHAIVAIAGISKKCGKDSASDFGVIEEDLFFKHFFS